MRRVAALAVVVLLALAGADHDFVNAHPSHRNRR
jgi:hypothetical protein